MARVRPGRDYYARVDGNDYSVDPRMIGLLVDVTATLTRVIVVSDGIVAAHPALISSLSSRLCMRGLTNGLWD